MEQDKFSFKLDFSETRFHVETLSGKKLCVSIVNNESEDRYLYHVVVTNEDTSYHDILDYTLTFKTFKFFRDILNTAVLTYESLYSHV